MQEPQNSQEPGEPRTGEGRPLFGGDTTGGAGAVSASDEKLWSILSHASVLVAPFGALIIWLIYKDRSPRIRFHALQALGYQVAWIAILIAYTILSTILTFVVIGIFMLILLPLLPLIPVAHGAYAAYRVSQGEDYRYPFVADKIDEMRAV